jgi:membrane-bound lytic murein transglycosylase A
MGSGVSADLLLERVLFEDLEGWARDDAEEALTAFRRSCNEIIAHGTGFLREARFGGSRPSWLESCRAALEAVDAKGFFESRFRAFRVKDDERPEGLFTGYFEPEVEGSRTASSVFSVPIYRRPPDLLTFAPNLRARSGLGFGRMIEGKPSPYLTRMEIEEGALDGQDLELVYLRDWADAFFIHVQGSGRVRLEDGSTMRLTYDAKSGLPYTSIGSLLVERGAFTRDDMSMQAIRYWMAAHPHQARHLMWKNQSFIFFRELLLDNPALGALGAQHVQLTPRRSLAVDRSHWMLGTPVWLDTDVPSGDEGIMTPFRQLLIAQDTGSAITGLARGDVYWGAGERAGRIAGRMKSPGIMSVLLPIPVADELGLPL